MPFSEFQWYITCARQGGNWGWVLIWVLLLKRIHNLPVSHTNSKSACSYATEMKSRCEHASKYACFRYSTVDLLWWWQSQENYNFPWDTLEEEFDVYVIESLPFLAPQGEICGQTLLAYTRTDEWDKCFRFGGTYIIIVTIQRRLAWPLRKDDTQIREAFQIVLFRHSKHMRWVIAVSYGTFSGGLAKTLWCGSRWLLLASSVQISRGEGTHPGICFLKVKRLEENCLLGGMHRDSVNSELKFRYYITHGSV